MKIVFATGIFPPDIGGPATYVERLAQEMKSQGFEVKIVTYSSGKGKECGFPVVRVSRKLPAGIRHFIYFLKLLKTAKGCDLIYSQNVTSAGLPGLLAAKLLRVGLSLKVVGDAAWEQNKGYLRAIQERVARSARTIIVPSFYLKERVMGWGVSGDKIEVVYNAPEEVPQTSLSMEQAKEKIGVSGDIILSIGRLAPWKGFSCLIDIMPDLLKENPNFQLVIVGKGAELSNLKKQVSNLKLENNVKLTGGVEHSQIPTYFKTADVFVLNSGYEGLSHVMLEAMGAGVPVIASNIGGNPELIENDFNGFLTEYNNKEQLKQAILNLWQDKKLQDKFIQNSQEKLKTFTWENLVKKTLEILQR